MSKRLTLRLQSLETPLAKAAAYNGRELASEAMHRLAASLGVDCPPQRSAGNPNMSTPAGAKKLAKKAVQERRKRKGKQA